MKHKLLISVFSLVIAVGPAAPVLAQSYTAPAVPTQSTQQLQDLINSLLEQVKQLQQKIAAQQPATPAAINQFAKLLSRGSSDQEVRALQEYLKQLGDYPEGIISGFFGPLTEAAVKRFQQRFGIPNTGVVGPLTRAKLNELLTAGAGQSGIIPPGLPSAPGIQGTATTPPEPVAPPPPAQAPAIYLFGGYDQTGGDKNDVWRSTDFKNWTQVSPHSAAPTDKWNPRRDFASVYFDKKIWVLGGYSKSASDPAATLYGDVWYSADGGATWRLANASAGWGKRYGHEAVVHDGKIWIIGGRDGGANVLKNDVWYSSDGANWTEAASGSAWGQRIYHSSVPFNGKLWVIGGNASITGLYVNDAWSSADGVNWDRLTADAAWEGSEAHASTVYNSRMWVLGGGGNNEYRKEVWWSLDGATWNRATNASGWDIRKHLAVTVFNGKMVLSGGMNASKFFNDVWTSSDGEFWSDETTSAPWTPRGQHALIATD